MGNMHFNDWSLRLLSGAEASDERQDGEEQRTNVTTVATMTSSAETKAQNAQLPSSSCWSPAESSSSRLMNIPVDSVATVASLPTDVARVVLDYTREEITHLFYDLAYCPVMVRPRFNRRTYQRMRQAIPALAMQNDVIELVHQYWAEPHACGNMRHVVSAKLFCDHDTCVSKLWCHHRFAYTCTNHLRAVLPAGWSDHVEHVQRRLASGVLESWWRAHFAQCRTPRGATPQDMAEFERRCRHPYPMRGLSFAKDIVQRCAGASFFPDHHTRQVVVRQCYVGWGPCDHDHNGGYRHLCHPRVGRGWRHDPLFMSPYSPNSYWWRDKPLDGMQSPEEREEAKTNPDYLRVFEGLCHGNYITGLNDGRCELNQSGMHKFLMPFDVARQFYNYC